MLVHNSIFQDYFSITLTTHKMMAEKQARILFPDSNEEIPSSIKSDEEDSKQTYTAIVFDQKDKERSYCQSRGRYSKLVQGSSLKDKNESMAELLKINSLSKMISNKEGRGSVAIFANTKLNKSIDKKSNKANQRPVSAFTKVSRQRYQNINFEIFIKESGSRLSRELSLSGKNYFEEPVVKPYTKEQQVQQTFHEFQPKFNENTENYGYVAKSRLISNKQTKKSHHIIHQKEDKKKSMHYESAISFQSLYNNLLINNKAVQNKRPWKQRNSQHLFHKKPKYSFHNTSMKNQQNSEIFHPKADPLIVASHQRKSINSKNIQRQLSSHLSTASFHKNKSRTLFTSQVLKSMKKGKNKISSILQLKKQEVIEPQLMIQNIQISKKKKQKNEKPIKTQFSESYCNISNYLSKLSAKNLNRGKKEQNCHLQIDCKQVAYY